MAKIQELLGKNLKDFKLVVMTEVYMMDNDGRKSRTLGYFRDQNTAVAYAGLQTDANYHKTEQVVVLTDGNIGFVIKHQDSVIFFDDEKVALEIRDKALAKLSPAERKFLGYE